MLNIQIELKYIQTELYIKRMPWCSSIIVQYINIKARLYRKSSMHRRTNSKYIPSYNMKKTYARSPDRQSMIESDVESLEEEEMYGKQS